MRDLIGLAATVYEPLYHVQEIATIKFSSGCSCKMKSGRSATFLIGINKTILPLSLVKYETINYSQLGPTCPVGYVSYYIVNNEIIE